MATRKVSKIARDVEIAGSLRVANGINSPDFARNVTETVAAKQDARNAEVAAEAAEAAATAASAAAAAASVLAQKAAVVFTSSSSSITRSRLGSYSPATITFTARLPDGTLYPGRIVIEETSDGETWTEVYRSAIDESSHEHTPSPAILGILAQLVDDSHVLKQLSIPVQESVDTAPVYLGSLTSLPSSGMLVNDYLFDARTAASGGGIMRYWTGSTWAEMTDAHPLYQQAVWNALADMGQWATDQDTVIAAASAIFDKLVAKNAMLASLFVQQIDVPDGGRIRYYNGQGVQKRCVQLAADRVDWLDTPDTSPASDELLRARIGRLGVGGAVLMDGAFEINALLPWGSPEIVESAGSSYPSIIQQADKTIRLVYRRFSDQLLVERTRTNGVWSSPAVVTDGQAGHSELIQRSSGEIRLCYAKATSPYLAERTFVDGGWSAETALSFRGDYPAYIEDQEGNLRLAYKRFEDGYLVERVLVDGQWSAAATINGALSEHPSYIRRRSGELRIAYARQSDYYLVERIHTLDGWGSELVVSAGSSLGPSYVETVDQKLKILYKNSSDKLVERNLAGSVWGSEIVIDTVGYSSIPDAIQLVDGSLLVAFSIGTGEVCTRTLQRYARLGAGITEQGLDANNDEYWVFGHGATVYPKKTHKIFTSVGSSSWTVPHTGRYKVTAQGGGGRGGQGQAIAGYGGGGGGCAVRWYDLVAGTSCAVVVGAGGTLSSAASASSFTDGTTQIVGGAGGNAANAIGGNGSPGVATNGELGLCGSCGGVPGANLEGGTGGASPMGGGGRGGYSNGNGAAGTLYGGAGGGGARDTGSSINNGGNGAQGVVIIEEV